MINFGPRWCGTHSQIIFDCEYDRLQQKRAQPKVLPKKRKRALTNPLELHRWQLQAFQHEAMLLQRLPVELRRSIWLEVLNGSTTTLHVVHKSHIERIKNIDYRVSLPRLGCWQCTLIPHISSVHEYFPPFKHAPSCSGSLSGGHSRTLGPAAPYGNYLPLLLTCRQIYTESIDLLYSSHVFSFADTGMLNVIASTILPQRLKSIRKLHLERALPHQEPFGVPISDYDSECSREEAKILRDFCQLVNRMEGLQELRIDIFNLEKRFHKSAAIEEGVLGPFAMIKPLRVFKIRTSWESMGFSDKGCPFRVLRPRDRQKAYALNESSYELEEDGAVDLPSGLV